jgi:hypothetical protein
LCARRSHDGHEDFTLHFPRSVYLALRICGAAITLRAFGPSDSVVAGVWKELTIWLLAVVLLALVRFGERLPLKSIGLGNTPWRQSVRYGCILTGLCGVTAWIVLSFTGYGHGPGSKEFNKIPIWFETLVVIRSSIVEVAKRTWLSRAAQLSERRSVPAFMRTWNKHIGIAVGLAAATLASGFGQTPDSTPTAKHGRVAEANRRYQNQQGRIAHGIDTGELNSREAGRLERREARLKAREKQDRSENPGGGLTGSEEKSLNRGESRLSSDIYAQKHDVQTESTTPHTVVGNRVENQQDRIARGLDKGSMNASEASRLEQREAFLQNQIRTGRNANGGTLTSAERAQAKQELDGLSQRIHQQNNDTQTQGH